MQCVLTGVSCDAMDERFNSHQAVAKDRWNLEDLVLFLTKHEGQPFRENPQKCSLERPGSGVNVPRERCPVYQPIQPPLAINNRRAKKSLYARVMANTQIPGCLICLASLATKRNSINQAASYPKKTFTKIQDIWLNDSRSRASIVKVVRNPARSQMLAMTADLVRICKMALSTYRYTIL